MAEANAILLPLAIVVPLLGALLGLIKPLRRIFGLSTALITLYIAARLLLAVRQTGPLCVRLLDIEGFRLMLGADTLSAFIVTSISLFSALLALYSPRAVDTYPGGRYYPVLILLTLAAANGAALSHSLLVLVFFWGCMAGLLYVLLLVSRKDAGSAAQKALIIVGASDILLLVGIALLIGCFGVDSVRVQHPLPLFDPLAMTAYLCLCVGALAKAGAMPVHSWIPEAATVAPASTMAFIPASLDKLLGIYLLVRASYYIFDISGNMTIKILLLTVGAITIVAAVMMAMMQKEAMKLLSFHAVSQVGYMVMGIGTGLPVGVAGGLFHMINHAMYKACLFLSAGSVEHRAKTSQLEYLGGLGSKMPWTLFSFLVAALAISGVPPLNGFYSKWMVYQGIVELARQTRLWPFFLLAAMFGSVLTLASFLKMIHSQFLGERPRTLDSVREAPVSMVVPGVLLAVLCIAFGIYANKLPLPYLILPSLPFSVAGLGFWAPTLGALLLLVGLLIGLLLFLSGTAAHPRTSVVFTGGEVSQGEEGRIPGTEFYSSIKFLSGLPRLLEQGNAGVYDLYNHFMRNADRVAALVFRYVDRLVDQVWSAMADVVGVFARTVRDLLVWLVALAVVPLLVYFSTGNVGYLKVFGFALMLGGPVIGLVEEDLTRFFYAIAVGQLGFVVTSLGSGHMMGQAVALYQMLTALVGLELVYMGIRSAIEVSGSPLVSRSSGIIRNAGVPAVGFILGGLMLSSMPPSANFLSKYIAATLYSGQPVAAVLIGLGALANLAAFLRITRRVFFGPPTSEARKGFGFEEALVLLFVIVNILAISIAGYFLEAAGMAGG